jgi:hypothetical protein
MMTVAPSVSIEGKLGPFRITRDQLIELVTQLNTKMSAPKKRVKEITVTLDRFSETCSSIEEFTKFLRDIQLPTVVRRLSLSLSSGNYHLSLFCGTAYAEYSIDGAADVARARSIEAVLIDFRDSHGAPRFMNELWELAFMMWLGLIAAVVVISLGGLEGRVVPVLTGVSYLTLLGYVGWTHVTRQPPPFSFYHTLLYMGKEPKNNGFWILVFTLLVEVVIGYVFTLLPR